MSYMMNNHITYNEIDLKFVNYFKFDIKSLEICDRPKILSL